MKLEVLKYCNNPLLDTVRLNTHKCRILDDKFKVVEYFDFYSDATFPDEISPDDLVGKIVEIEEMFPFSPFQFGRGVTVCKEQS